MCVLYLDRAINKKFGVPISYSLNQIECSTSFLSNPELNSPECAVISLSENLSAAKHLIQMICVITPNV